MNFRGLGEKRGDRAGPPPTIRRRRGVRAKVERRSGGGLPGGAVRHRPGPANGCHRRGGPAFAPVGPAPVGPAPSVSCCQDQDCRAVPSCRPGAGSHGRRLGWAAGTGRAQVAMTAEARRRDGGGGVPLRRRTEALRLGPRRSSFPPAQSRGRPAAARLSLVLCCPGLTVCRAAPGGCPRRKHQRRAKPSTIAGRKLALA